MTMHNALFPEGVVMESAPCPLGCAPDDEWVLDGIDRLHGVPGKFSVMRCKCCGLVRTDPRPSPQSIGAYYPEDYAPYLAAAPPRTQKKRVWRHRAKDRIARWLGRDTRRLPRMPAGHLLEIGCASGSYLLEMQGLGWTAEGIEFSATAAQRARSMGFEIQTASVETATAPRQPADLIAAWNVLEHLHQPIQALQKIRSWLKTDGYLVGVVPDFEAFDRKLFNDHWYALHLPCHLYHYSRPTLRGVLEAAGWELVQTRWQPNERNFLNSLDSWLSQREMHRGHRAVQWLKSARSARRYRRWLGWLLGVSGQSGRMEFWARPVRNQGSKP